MSGQLIVDGYNLARSGEISLGADPMSPEGRRELSLLLASYAMEKGLRLTVVYDGRGAGKIERSRESFKGGAVIYSSRIESADDVIRDLARNASAGTIVITSDRGLAGTLPSRNIHAVSCEEFASLLYNRQLAEIKGGPDDEDKGKSLSVGARRKKGEGHRPKKQERKRERLLRKL